MKYLVSILRIFVLVAVVLAIANFSDIKKTRAAGNPDPTHCTGTSAPYDCTITSSINNTQLSVYEDMNLTISAGTTTTSGSHHFNNVTLKGTGNVTHAALVLSSKSISDEPDKKIDWTIERTLTMSDNSSFNANGTGYQGAINSNGSGSGGGQSMPTAVTSLPSTVTDCAGGGGGLGGNGQNGSGQDTPPTIALGGVYGGVNIDTIDRGSGGGSASCNNLSKAGWAGGGIIKIEAKQKIDMSGGSMINARGLSTAASVVTGGGGAGGTIWLKTRTFTSDNSNTSKVGPVVTGGKRGTDTAPIGITNVAPNMAYYTINASGGSSSITGHGGGGGGGIVKIYTDTAAVDCVIKDGTNIPSICEGKNVIIDGINNPNLTIYTTNSLQHHFLSLKIRNNAVLTHESLSPLMDFNTAAPYALTPFGQSKKVDLLIDGDLTLESGGKIDVSGKGYPGGLGTRIPNGCGALDTTADTGSTQHGYGPGGGLPIYICDTSGSYTIGGGGGYGGKGGDGRKKFANPDPIVAGGSVYPVPYNHDLSSSEFQFGSGGGSAACHNAGYSASSSGTAGGGRVKILSNTISFSNSTSYIAANGLNGEYAEDKNATHAIGGSGSGGTIWLKSSNINGQVKPQFYGTAADPTADPMGYILGDGQNGSIDGWNGLSNINLKANGGQSIKMPHNGGGSGGRIVIGPGSTPTLTANLLAAPASGQTSISTVLTSAVTGGSATGTINYTFWWHCTNPSNSVDVVKATCGDPDLATNGAKFAPTNANPQSTPAHIYTAGNYTAKVIVERGGAVPVVVTATVNVTTPPNSIQSKKVEVTVKWTEGTQPKEVKLYNVLRSVVAP